MSYQVGYTQGQMALLDQLRYWLPAETYNEVFEHIHGPLMRWREGRGRPEDKGFPPKWPT